MEVPPFQTIATARINFNYRLIIMFQLKHYHSENRSEGSSSNYYQVSLKTISEICLEE